MSINFCASGVNTSNLGVTALAFSWVGILNSTSPNMAASSFLISSALATLIASMSSGVTCLEVIRLPSASNIEDAVVGACSAAGGAGVSAALISSLGTGCLPGPLTPITPAVIAPITASLTVAPYTPSIASRLKPSSMSARLIANCS